MRAGMHRLFYVRDGGDKVEGPFLEAALSAARDNVPHLPLRAFEALLSELVATGVAWPSSPAFVEGCCDMLSNRDPLPPVTVGHRVATRAVNAGASPRSALAMAAAMASGVVPPGR